jgi:hypothetical protein
MWGEDELLLLFAVSFVTVGIQLQGVMGASPRFRLHPQQHNNYNVPGLRSITPVQDPSSLFSQY